MFLCFVELILIKIGIFGENLKLLKNLSRRLFEPGVYTVNYSTCNCKPTKYHKYIQCIEMMSHDI